MVSVTRDMLQRFLLSMYNKGFSTSTMIAIKALITKSFNFAYQDVGSSLELAFGWEGHYQALVQTWNGVGSKSSEIIDFVIGSPTYAVLSTDKSSYAKDETETLLQKFEDSRQSQMYAIRDIEEIKEQLLSFGKYVENAAPDVLVTLIQTFVERIYITDENDERHCHIFIKGCSKEDYDDFFRATGYIENTQETGAVTSVLPVCDSDECCKHYVILTSVC